MTESREFDAAMLEFIVCPQTGSRLHFDTKTGELVSKQARLAFPVRNGIPIMLIDEARQID